MRETTFTVSPLSQINHLLVFLVRFFGDEFRLVELCLQNCHPVVLHVGPVLQGFAYPACGQRQTFLYDMDIRTEFMQQIVFSNIAKNTPPFLIF